jgi:flagellar hook-length control protein FliK
VPGAEGAALLAQAMLLPREGHAPVAASTDATADSAADIAIAWRSGAAGTSDAGRLASSAAQDATGQDADPTGGASAPPLLVHREKADSADKVAGSRTVVQTLAVAADRRTPPVSASDALAPSWQDRAQAHMPARAQTQRQSEAEVRAQALPEQPAIGLVADAANAEAAAQATLSSSPWLARRSERGEDRGLAWSTGTLAHEAGSALASVQPTPSPFMPAVDAAMAATALANPMTEQLMEQISWYLSQKTQGAQLTLDVPGGLPVSVSIQVQGNEAQIAFRSDQPEARQLLTQSLPQKVFGLVQSKLAWCVGVETSIDILRPVEHMPGEETGRGARRQSDVDKAMAVVSYEILMVRGLEQHRAALRMVHRGHDDPVPASPQGLLAEQVLGREQVQQ